MMSKRFQKTRIVDKWGGIYDSETDKVLSVNDVEHKLNEQQAIIQHLTIEKHQADKRLQTIIADLKEENEKLRKELDNFKPVMFQDVRKGTVILYSKGD